MVRCRDLVKQFRAGSSTVRALRGVNLDVHAGQLTLLVGPSGCGKTTLLSVIAGILEPTSGVVEVLGKDLPHYSSSRKARFRRDNIGFVFQQFNLLPALTALENAAVPRIIAGERRRQALEQSMQLMNQMGMAERVHSFPHQLSGGEQQRVAIARALVNDPRLVVCDEPTSSLDARTGHTIMEVLRETSVQADRAVIVVTHDPRVYGFADRIATMEDGAVIGVEAGEAAQRDATTSTETAGAADPPSRPEFP